jgi:WD40 repeat protein
VRPGLEADALPMFASAGSDRTVRLWQPTIGRMMKIRRLPAAVLSVAWSEDGKQLLAGCADGTIRVIDPDSLEVIAEEKLMEGWITTLAVNGREALIGGEKGRLVRYSLPRQGGSSNRQ